MESIKDKVALITGASSGFGEACAKLFAENGARLILAARRDEKLKRLAGELTSKFGVEIHTLKMDVRNRIEVKNEIEGLIGNWKNIDILINNAGLSRGLDKLYEGKIDDWEEMIDTNIKGLLYVSRAVIPQMVKRNSGHIVNIGSIAGHEVYPNGNVYCASKHAVDAITKGMRIDLNGTSVRITTIDPGLAETEFSMVRFRGDKQRAGNVYRNLEPLSADDVADAVLFAVTRRSNTVIAELIIMPVCQANTTTVSRK